MVTILPAVQKRPTFMQQLGLGFSKGIETAFQEYEKYQKKQDLSKAFEDIKGIYGNPKMDEQQKFVEAFGKLREFPDVAKQLAGNLSRLGIQKQKSFLEQLKGEKTQQQTAQAFQNIQGIYNNPDLSDEQKTFGVYQQLSQNPTLAHNLLGSINQQRKAAGQDVAGQQFSKGYDAIVDDDNDDLRNVLDDPKTPLNVKQKLTDLWDSRQIRKDVGARELRTRQSLVGRSYYQAITNEQNRLKGEYLKPAERTSIKAKIGRLQKSLRKDMQRLTKDPNSYTDLAIWNELDPEFLPAGEEENGFEGGGRGMGAEPARVMFDPNNKEHRAKAQQLYNHYKDKEKVRQKLSQEFEGL